MTSPQVSPPRGRLLGSPALPPLGSGRLHAAAAAIASDGGNTQPSANSHSPPVSQEQELVALLVSGFKTDLKSVIDVLRAMIQNVRAAESAQRDGHHHRLQHLTRHQSQDSVVTEVSPTEAVFAAPHHDEDANVNCSGAGSSAVVDEVAWGRAGLYESLLRGIVDNAAISHKMDVDTLRTFVRVIEHAAQLIIILSDVFTPLTAQLVVELCCEYLASEPVSSVHAWLLCLITPIVLQLPDDDSAGPGQASRPFAPTRPLATGGSKVISTTSDAVSVAVPALPDGVLLPPAVMAKYVEQQKLLAALKQQDDVASNENDITEAQLTPADTDDLLDVNRRRGLKIRELRQFVGKFLQDYVCRDCFTDAVCPASGSTAEPSVSMAASLRHNHSVTSTSTMLTAIGSPPSTHAAAAPPNPQQAALLSKEGLSSLALFRDAARHASAASGQQPQQQAAGAQTTSAMFVPRLDLPRLHKQHQQLQQPKGSGFQPTPMVNSLGAGPLRRTSLDFMGPRVGDSVLRQFGLLEHMKTRWGGKHALTTNGGRVLPPKRGLGGAANPSSSDAVEALDAASLKGGAEMFDEQHLRDVITCGHKVGQLFGTVDAKMLLRFKNEREALSAATELETGAYSARNNTSLSTNAPPLLSQSVSNANDAASPHRASLLLSGMLFPSPARGDAADESVADFSRTAAQRDGLSGTFSLNLVAASAFFNADMLNSADGAAPLGSYFVAMANHVARTLFGSAKTGESSPRSAHLIVQRSGDRTSSPAFAADLQTAMAVAEGVQLKTRGDRDPPPPSARDVHTLALQSALTLLRFLPCETAGSMTAACAPLLLGFQLLDAIDCKLPAYLDPICVTIAAFIMERESALFSLFKEPTTLVGFPVGGPAGDAVPKDGFLTLWATVVLTLLELTPTPYEALAWCLASLCHIVRRIPKHSSVSMQIAATCSTALHDVLEQLRKDASFNVHFSACLHYCLELFDVMLDIAKSNDALIAVLVSMFVSSFNNPIGSFLRTYAKRVLVAEDPWALFGIPQAAATANAAMETQHSFVTKRFSSSNGDTSGDDGAATLGGGGRATPSDESFLSPSATAYGDCSSFLETLFWPDQFCVAKHRVRLLHHYRCVARFTSLRHHGGFLSLAHETNGEHPADFILNPLEGLALIVLSDVAPPAWFAMRLEVLRLIEEVCLQPPLMSPMLAHSTWVATYTRFLYLAFLESYHSPSFVRRDECTMSFCVGLLRALTSLCGHDSIARTWAYKLGIVRTLVHEVDLEHAITETREKQLRKSTLLHTSYQRDPSASPVVPRSARDNSSSTQQHPNSPLSRARSPSVCSSDSALEIASGELRLPPSKALMPAVLVGASTHLSIAPSRELHSPLISIPGDFATQLVAKDFSTAKKHALLSSHSEKGSDSAEQTSEQHVLLSPPAESMTTTYQQNPDALSSSDEAVASDPTAFVATTAVVTATHQDEVISSAMLSGSGSIDDVHEDHGAAVALAVDALVPPPPPSNLQRPVFVPPLATSTTSHFNGGTLAVSQQSSGGFVSPVSLGKSTNASSGMMMSPSIGAASSSAAGPPRVSFVMPKLSLGNVPPPMYYTSNGDTGACVEATMSNVSFVKSGSFAFPSHGADDDGAAYGNCNDNEDREQQPFDPFNDSRGSAEGDTKYGADMIDKTSDGTSSTETGEEEPVCGPEDDAAAGGSAEDCARDALHMQHSELTQSHSSDIVAPEEQQSSPHVLRAHDVERVVPAAVDAPSEMFAPASSSKVSGVDRESMGARAAHLPPPLAASQLHPQPQSIMTPTFSNGSSLTERQPSSDGSLSTPFSGTSAPLPQAAVSGNGPHEMIYIPPLAMSHALRHSVSGPRSPSARANRTVRLVEPSAVAAVLELEAPSKADNREASPEATAPASPRQQFVSIHAPLSSPYAQQTESMDEEVRNASISLAASRRSEVGAESSVAGVYPLHLVMNETKFAQHQRAIRRVYMNRTVQAEIIFLLLSLLVSPQGTLDPLYTSEFLTARAKKANALFYLHMHLNHDANAKAVQLLWRRVSLHRPVALQSGRGLAQHHKSVSLLLQLIEFRTSLASLYERQEKIGVGGNGAVVAAIISEELSTSSLTAASPSVGGGVLVAPQQRLALKMAPVPHHIEGRDTLQTFFNEAAVLSLVQDMDSTAQIVDCGCDGTQYMIVLPLYRLSARDWRVKIGGTGALPPTRQLFLQAVHVYSSVLRAMCDVHSRRIVHHDVKADNVFLDVSTTASATCAVNGSEVSDASTSTVTCSVRIGDWGEAQVVPTYTHHAMHQTNTRGVAGTDTSVDATHGLDDAAGDFEADNADRHAFHNIQHLFTHPRGTECTRPPEGLLPHRFARQLTSSLAWRDPATLLQKADVWAAGCLLYELLTGDILFGDAEFGKVLMRVTSDSGELLEAVHKNALHAVGGADPGNADSHQANLQMSNSHGTPSSEWQDTARLQVGPAMLDFLAFVLERDPEFRPTMHDVRQRWEELVAAHSWDFSASSGWADLQESHECSNGGSLMSASGAAHGVVSTPVINRISRKSSRQSLLNNSARPSVSQRRGAPWAQLLDPFSVGQVLAAAGTGLRTGSAKNRCANSPKRPLLVDDPQVVNACCRHVLFIPVSAGLAITTPAVTGFLSGGPHSGVSVGRCYEWGVTHLFTFTHVPGADRHFHYCTCEAVLQDYVHAAAAQSSTGGRHTSAHDFSAIVHPHQHQQPDAAHGNGGHTSIAVPEGSLADAGLAVGGVSTSFLWGASNPTSPNAPGSAAGQRALPVPLVAFARAVTVNLVTMFHDALLKNGTLLIPSFVIDDVDLSVVGVLVLLSTTYRISLLTAMFHVRQHHALDSARTSVARCLQLAHLLISSSLADQRSLAAARAESAFTSAATSPRVDTSSSTIRQKASGAVVAPCVASRHNIDEDVTIAAVRRGGNARRKEQLTRSLASQLRHAALDRSPRLDAKITKPVVIPLNSVLPRRQWYRCPCGLCVYEVGLPLSACTNAPLSAGSPGQGSGTGTSYHPAGMLMERLHVQQLATHRVQRAVSKAQNDEAERYVSALSSGLVSPAHNDPLSSSYRRADAAGACYAAALCLTSSGKAAVAALLQVLYIRLMAVYGVALANSMVATMQYQVTRHCPPSRSAQERAYVGRSNAGPYSASATPPTDELINVFEGEQEGRALHPDAAADQEQFLGSWCHVPLRSGTFGYALQCERCQAPTHLVLTSSAIVSSVKPTGVFRSGATVVAWVDLPWGAAPSKTTDADDVLDGMKRASWLTRRHMW